VGAGAGLVGEVATAVLSGRITGPEAVQEAVSRTENVDYTSPHLEIVYDWNAVHHHHRHASALLHRTSFTDFGRDFHARCARHRSEHVAHDAT
jgi:hypothetical protein